MKKNLIINKILKKDLSKYLKNNYVKDVEIKQKKSFRVQVILFNVLMSLSLFHVIIPFFFQENLFYNDKLTLLLYVAPPLALVIIVADHLNKTYKKRSNIKRMFNKKSNMDEIEFLYLYSESIDEDLFDNGINKFITLEISDELKKELTREFDEEDAKKIITYADLLICRRSKTHIETI